MNGSAVHVLVIEDDKQDFEYIGAMLGRESNPAFRLKHCTNLRQGISQLEGEAIDLVLLDLDLPDSYGYATFNAVNSTAPQVPIVLMTGNDNDQLARKAAKNGAYSYLVKGDINRNMLVRTLYCVLERDRLVRELEQARRVERHLAYHDSLTNLPNRKLFYDRLRQAIKQAKRSHETVAVLFVDLDEFKAINDFFGHEHGDTVLRVVARRLRASVRETDTVARIGGDEFTVILEGINQALDVSKVCEKILAELSKPITIDGEEVKTPASIGISLFPHDAGSVENVVRNADIAMYRAKNSKNPTYEFYNDTTKLQALGHHNEEALLRRAIDNDEIVPYYQPQVDIETGRIVGVEALARWKHPERGLLVPAHFIPLAEETGLIVPMGEWILRAACKQAQQWQSLGSGKLRIAVNLSARQFRVSQLKQLLEDILQETNLDPTALVLEITETAVIRDVGFTVNVLDSLKDLGIRISIDDFGVGYSSLNYLKRFPIDMLKIDQSCIKGLHLHPDDWSIVAAIIDMSHRLNLSVLAEGVEYNKQLTSLRKLGCDEYQGHYKSPPISADNFTEILTTQSQ